MTETSEAPKPHHARHQEQRHNARALGATYGAQHGLSISTAPQGSSGQAGSGVPEIAQGNLLVNGCFWHCHECARGARIPKNNREYWVNKIAGNTLRDRSNLKKLATKGWASLVIWECHVGNTAKLETKVREFLRGA